MWATRGVRKLRETFSKAANPGPIGILAAVMTANNTVLTPAGVSKVSVVQKRSGNRFIANTATILGAQVGGAFLALLLEVVYARFLGPSGRGQLSLSMMVIGCT